jgi:hypothetical protein
MFNRAHLVWAGFELIRLVVIGTDCICSCKSNYHTITTITATILYHIHGLLLVLYVKMGVCFPRSCDTAPCIRARSHRLRSSQRHLSYLVTQSFDYKLTWLRLFNKAVVRTNLDIHVCIFYYWKWSFPTYIAPKLLNTL